MNLAKKLAATVLAVLLAPPLTPAFGQTNVLDLLEADDFREHFDDRYNGFLESYQPIQIQQKICANPTQQSDCLKVYVLDSRSEALQELPEFQRLLRLNALAIPDDTILLDSFLLDLLMRSEIGR